jgi:hypothetical protein
MLLFEDFFEKVWDVGEREALEIAGDDNNLSASRKSRSDGTTDREIFLPGTGALCDSNGDDGDQDLERVGLSGFDTVIFAAFAAHLRGLSLTPLKVSDDDEAVGLGTGDPLGDRLGEGNGKS